MNKYELYHHGVKGQKWGIRRYQNADGSLTSAGKKRQEKSSYSSTGIRSAIARKQNEKIDKSFKSWNENTEKKTNAIDAGKKRNQSKIAYEKDKTNKDLKKQYKSDESAYRKALKSNTTYRKGQIKKEVGSDLSRKYLSEAKKVKKQLDGDPSNKQLQKQYNSLMSKHDIERANARRAPEVAANRSKIKANIKRNMTVTVKTAATAAVISGGIYVVNKYSGSSLNSEQVNQAINIGKTIMGYSKYLY